MAPIIQYKYTDSKTFPFPWTEPPGHPAFWTPPLPTWPSLIKPPLMHSYYSYYWRLCSLSEKSPLCSGERVKKKTHTNFLGALFEKTSSNLPNTEVCDKQGQTQVPSLLAPMWPICTQHSRAQIPISTCNPVSVTATNPEMSWPFNKLLWALNTEKETWLVGDQFLVKRLF